MATGRASKAIPFEVDFFDWTRNNINSTSELVHWCSRFGDDPNKVFHISEDKKLVLTTVLGEDIIVEPGSVILRDNNGKYFKMSQSTFERSYGVIEENGAPLETPQ